MATTAKEVYCPVVDGPCQALDKTPCVNNPSEPLCERRADDLANQILTITLQALADGGLARLLNGESDALSQETIQASPMVDVVAQSLASAAVELGLSPEQTRLFYLRATQKSRHKLSNLMGIKPSLSDEITQSRDFENKIPPIE